MCIISRTRSAICSLLLATSLMPSINVEAMNKQMPESVGIWQLIEQQNIEVTKKTIEFAEQKGCENPEIGETKEIQHTRADEVICNRWVIELTPDERELLAKIVYLEAGNQGLEGQEYVTTVIFNRMRDDYFQGSLYEVLSRDNPVQFETWKNREKSKPTDETYEAIDNVLNGIADKAITDCTYLYFSRGKGSKNAVKIGDHYFW